LLSGHAQTPSPIGRGLGRGVAPSIDMYQLPYHHEGRFMKREPEDWPHAVVFDLDGTLVDSAADIADALNRTIALRGLAPFTLAEVKAMVGGGVPKLAERALIARGAAVADVPAIVAGFVQFYRERLTAKTTLCE